MRHDGDHKADDIITGLFARHVELIPVCPEVEAGMGVPREPVTLVDDNERVRMLGVRTARDWTGEMMQVARARATALTERNICGYIFKSRSPSCAIDDAARSTDGVTSMGPGLFTQVLRETMPSLPLIDESRLSEPVERAHFIKQMFIYRRLRRFLSKERTVGQFVMFNAQSKMQLSIHDPDAYDALTEIIVAGKDREDHDLARTFERRFMDAFQSPATLQSEVDTLRMVLDVVRERVAPRSYSELADAVSRYERGEVPAIVVVTLIRHLVKVEEVPMLDGQSYLEPHPKEMLLLNHV